QQTAHALLPEELESSLAAEDHSSGRKSVSSHCCRGDDRHARQVPYGPLRARVENVSLAHVCAGAALVITRGAHRAFSQTECLRNESLGARVLNTDLPVLARGVVTAHHDVSASLDTQVGVGLQLAGGQVDGQTLGDRVQIENHWPLQL